VTRRHLVVALLACAALGAAVAGRLLACAGCDYAILGVPLFAAGSAVYLGLGLAALFGVRLRLIGWIALPAVALQAGLARFLLQAGVPCATCLLSAGLILSLSLAALWPEGKWRWAPAAAALAGVAALPLWSRALVETERLPGLPEFARSTDVRNAPDGAVLMVVYEREACSFCKSFRKEYEPRLLGEFGSKLMIRRVEASRDRTGLRRLPTFLIRGLNGSYIVVRGLPSYEDLASKIRNVE
jgi:hypothetical protein